MMLLLKNAYLCPGDDAGEHITDDPLRCQCGSSNLHPLERILLSKSIKQKERPYDGICSSIPVIKEMFLGQSSRGR